MSKFFAGAGSSSEEEEEYVLSSTSKTMDSKQQRKFMADSGSSSEDDSSSSYGSDAESEVMSDTADKQRQKEMETRRSRFLIGSDSESDSDEDVQRVVKSQKDKAHVELNGIQDSIGDAIDADEWTVVSTDFDRWLKSASRALRYGALPESFFDFVDFLADVDKSAEQVKKLKADEARAFNTFKHKYKKTDFESFKASSVTIQQQQDELAKPRVMDDQQFLDEITAANVPMKIQEILGTRGRRKGASERSENEVVLKRCLQAANTPELKSQVLVALLSTMMDSSVGSMSADQLVALLDNLASLGSELTRCDVKKESGSEQTVSAINYAVSYAALLQRCDDEYSLSINSCDHHSPAYMELIKIELASLMSELRRAILVLNRFGLDEFVLECQWRLLERLYYRQSTNTTECKSLLTALYSSGQEVMQARALLCHVHILAVRNRFAEAKQLLSSSHLQDHISRFSINHQILYNRCLVQLGLAAFRSGAMMDTYFCLHEICSSGRPKELVGQGLSPSPATTSSSQHHQRQERLRLVPHHCHVNIELVDTVFSIASVLLEVPQAAAQHAGIHSPNPRKIFQSRHLKRILDTHERSLFNGPPENSRETIVAACRALIVGDWRKCQELLVDGIKVWPGNMVADVKRVVSEKVRRAALLTMIYTMAVSTTVFDCQFLAQRFELEQSVVAECLKAHASLTTADDGKTFTFKDTKQLRQDHVERTLSCLRELCIPNYANYADDMGALEYVMYGQSLSAPAVDN